MVGSEAESSGQAPVAASVTTSEAGTSADKTVSGIIQISAKFAAQASPEDTLFVFAKAAQGPKMPLAVLRKQVKDLPLEFTFDDSMAMSPAAKLSDFNDVVITARVSKSGTALQQSGDLTGASPVVKLGSQKLSIRIDAMVP